MDKLIELAERCEQASGPDRELDLDIARCLGVTVMRQNEDDTGGHEWTYWRYTASLDAAMTLVPKGWHSSICTTEGAQLRGSAALRDRDGGPSFTSAAATPALSVCAASLRALAAQEKPNG